MDLLSQGLKHAKNLQNLEINCAKGLDSDMENEQMDKLTESLSEMENLQGFVF